MSPRHEKWTIRPEKMHEGSRSRLSRRGRRLQDLAGIAHLGDSRLCQIYDSVWHSIAICSRGRGSVDRVGIGPADQSRCNDDRIAGGEHDSLVKSYLFTAGAYLHTAA